jgi:hypothetical protein
VPATSSSEALADPLRSALESSGRIRVLAALVTVEAVLMLAGGIAFLGWVLAEGDRTGYANRHDAVALGWVLLATLALWGVALLFTARGIRRGRRWSFSVVLFTQMMWGFIALTSLSSSGGGYLVALVVVLAVVIATVAGLFQPEVRYLLGRGPAPAPRPPR